MRIFLVAFFWFGSLIPSLALGADFEREERFIYTMESEDLGIPFKITVEESPVKRCESSQDILYMRYKLTLDIPQEPQENKTEMTIQVSKQGDEKVLETIHLTNQRKTIWTAVIPGACVEFITKDSGKVWVYEKMLNRLGSKPKSRFPPDQEFTKSYHSPWELQGNNIIRRMASQSGFIRFIRWDPDKKKDREATCTGFMISSKFLITNEHCLNKTVNLETVSIFFGYRGISSAGIEKFNKRAKPRILLIDNYELDLAVVEISEPKDAFESIPWILKVPEFNDNIAIVQHPEGKEMLYASDPQCKIIEDQQPGRNGFNNDFTHECDTDFGSSGSAVLLLKSFCKGIIGLHHWGIDEEDSTSKNQGVKINKIYEFFKNGTNIGEEDEDSRVKRLKVYDEAIKDKIITLKCEQQ